MRKITAFLLAALLSIAPAYAAGPTPNSYVTPQGPLNIAASFPSTSVVAIVDCSGSLCANGAIITTLTMCDLNTSAANTIKLALTNGAVTALLGDFATAGPSCNASALAVNLLGTSAYGPMLPKDANGNPYILVAAGWKLVASFSSSPTSAINVFAAGGAY